ncbi:hypothetical protein Pmani_038976 [Petrolisthes manimaculis]|uniref:Uncharacterized protein n=1 Tax=Petrolisthes manimaculis TaxID=1843537 RepID=A0AAE1NDL7_9EUCA|nr:hypothetical protein Pmani_038976 [Petrolisthes manimaculis]
MHLQGGRLPCLTLHHPALPHPSLLTLHHPSLLTQPYPSPLILPACPASPCLLSCLHASLLSLFSPFLNNSVSITLSDCLSSFFSHHPACFTVIDVSSCLSASLFHPTCLTLPVPALPVILTASL